MDVDALSFPPELHYLVDNDVWVRFEADGEVTVGITALGIKLAGEIYMCRVKPPGTRVEQGRSIAVVELAKAIVSVKAAVGGMVITVNAALEKSPDLVHRDPYCSGWLARLAPVDLVADRARLVHGSEVREAMARHAAGFGSDAA